MKQDGYTIICKAAETAGGGLYGLYLGQGRRILISIDKVRIND
jgi:hypothetical protein